MIFVVLLNLSIVIKEGIFCAIWGNYMGYDNLHPILAYCNFVC